jgi:hypothetical protein
MSDPLYEYFEEYDDDDEGYAFSDERTGLPFAVQSLSGYSGSGDIQCLI